MKRCILFKLTDFELFVNSGTRKQRSWLPEDWRECFGVPFERHDDLYKINLAKAILRQIKWEDWNERRIDQRDRSGRIPDCQKPIFSKNNRSRYLLYFRRPLLSDRALFRALNNCEAIHVLLSNRGRSIVIRPVTSNTPDAVLWKKRARAQIYKD